MKIEKVKQNWYVDGERIRLYELYAVWLISEHPGVRPGQVTPEMVREFAEDRKTKTA